MRYAKTFLATFALAFAAFAAVPAQGVAATDSSVIFIDENGSIDEVWIIVIDGEIAAV